MGIFVLFPGRRRPFSDPAFSVSSNLFSSSVYREELFPTKYRPILDPIEPA